MIARSPTVWYSTVKIDKGSSDGIRRNQPVIAAGGLAGKVTTRDRRQRRGHADHRRLERGLGPGHADGANGIVKPEVGKPDDLLLDFVQKRSPVTEGTTVVTSGFTSSEVDSLFPRGIPIGQVTRVDPDEVDALPARAHQAVRRPAPHRLRPGAHRARRPGREAAVGAP